MKPIIAKILVRLYPRAWRERYGDEFAAMLEQRRSSLSEPLDIVRSALRERMIPKGGLKMATHTNDFGGIVRQPSAFIPMAMSMTALAVVIGHIALYGVARETDEGAAAHIWQLLMAGQVPVLLFFAVKWLPRAPKQSLLVLALQAGAVLASLAPVFFLHL